MMKDDREVQPENTSLPITESVSGRLISVNDVHEVKALSPMETNDEESLTLVRLLHSEKASGPIARTESGTSMERSEEQD